MDPLSLFLLGLVVNVVAYMLAPKPKQAKPAAAEDLQNPEAEAGKPVPVVFGTITVKGLNIFWHGDKSIKTYEVDA